ncbi:metal-binding protein [Laceyella sacchari]|uniref:Glyoxylase, beta-lactamase superfamily II n=1 Tax=Laceyella tengchongensis TaxID=574699 RepID=A0AA45WLL4_9BACL|nr:MBL fold metallo-hydrolase [Laceyella tengchongensis]AUS09368.1 metal-binding protein [Laceyella sacchari]SMP11312.1 Glyoxylase, beta-lactamase superfamily II [Laceyella tengchongensis]
MKIETFVFGPVMTNCYLVHDEESRRGWVVDPGMNPDALLARIRELDIKVEAILLTHAHFDHIGGVEAVRERSGAPVYVHREEADWLTNPEKNGSLFFMGVPMKCQPAERVLTGGESIELVGQTLKVLHTPGHSPGSVTYVWDDVIFSGDVLFQQSIGRTDLPGGDYETLMKSIHQQLMNLPEATRVLSGHGPETTIGQEQMTNPFVTGGLTNR